MPATRRSTPRAATVLRRAWLLPLAALIGGCAIGTPLDTRRLRAAAPPGPLEVSITHAVVDPARRGDFDRWTRRVNASLDNQPGLLVHAIRKELFGDQAWTFTVWASAADRERFVRATDHRRAMAEASTGLASMRSVRLRIDADALPSDWDQVLALLDDAAARSATRSYGGTPAQPD